MLKKILISFLGLIILSVGGISLYNHVKHKPVYGILVLDKDEKRVTDAINSQKGDIEKSIVVNGKWVKNSNTLVLNTTDAKKIATLNGFQKVTSKKNEYTFEAIKQISKDEATLFSKENAPLIKDEANKAFSSKVHEYVILGESSAYVHSMFILPDNQYNEFTGSPISLGVLKVKSDASKVLINYNNVEMNQLYDER